MNVYVIGTIQSYEVNRPSRVVNHASEARRVVGELLSDLHPGDAVYIQQWADEGGAWVMVMENVHQVEQPSRRTPIPMDLPSEDELTYVRNPDGSTVRLRPGVAGLSAGFMEHPPEPVDGAALFTTMWQRLMTHENKAFATFLAACGHTPKYRWMDGDLNLVLSMDKPQPWVTGTMVLPVLTIEDVERLVPDWRKYLEDNDDPDRT